MFNTPRDLFGPKCLDVLSRACDSIGVCFSCGTSRFTTQDSRARVVSYRLGKDEQTRLNLWKHAYHGKVAQIFL